MSCTGWRDIFGRKRSAVRHEQGFGKNELPTHLGKTDPTIRNSMAEVHAAAQNWK